MRFSWLKVFVFFLFSILLLSLLRWGIYISVDVPRAINLIDVTKEEIITNYPENLDITWKDNQLSVSQTTGISYPSWFNNNLGLPNQFILLQGETTPNQLSKSSYLFQIRDSALIPQMNGRSGEATPLSTLLPDATFKITAQNKSLALSELETYAIDWLEQSAIVVLIVLFLFLFLKLLFIALIENVLIFILLKIMGSNKTFLDCLKISLTVIVIAQCINSVVYLLYQQPFNIVTTAFWAYYITIILINYRYFTSSKVT